MSTQTIHEDATHIRTAATTDLKLEVVVIPVSDVDRAKRFYESLGWRLDADFASGDDWRLVQMTPPGSPCSVMFGKGFTPAAPGSVQGTFLVVDDLDGSTRPADWTGCRGERGVPFRWHAAPCRRDDGTRAWSGSGRPFLFLLRLIQ